MNCSVIIPTYNGASFIRDALESVFAQTKLPAEIIVVDDCSTDATLDIVDALVAASPIPIRVMSLNQNSGGPATPMNVGTREARGAWIAVLDQDDVYHPENLDLQSQILRDHPKIGLVFSWCGRLDRPGAVQQSETLRQKVLSVGASLGSAMRLPSKQSESLLLEYTGGLVVGFPGMMWRKSLWMQCGGFRESLRIAVDYDFLLRATGVCDFAVVPRIGYQRRQHDMNLCHDKNGVVHEIAMCKALYALEHGPGGLPPTEKWDDLIRAAAWFERTAGRHASAFRLLSLGLLRFGNRAANLRELLKCCLSCMSIHPRSTVEK